MLLWVVDFFNGKTKGRFDPQAAMLHDQCQMLEDASRQLMGEKRLVAGCSGIEPHQVRILVFHPVSDLSGARGRLRSRRRWRSHRFLSCLRQSFRHRRESVRPSLSLPHFFPVLSEPDWQLRVASVPFRYFRIPVSGGGGCGHHTPHLPQKNGTSQTIAPAVK